MEKSRSPINPTDIQSGNELISDIWNTDDPNWFKPFELDSDKSIEDIFMIDIYLLKAYGKDLDPPNDIYQNYMSKDTFINGIVDILNRQRFLSIIGGYGSGKTTLSKVLYKYLYEKYEVKSIGAYKLLEMIRNNEFAKFKNYLNMRKIEYLFLDALDDIDFKMDINGKKINFFDEVMQKLLEFLKENAALKVLINSRALKSEVNNSELDLYLAIYYFENFNKNAGQFIFINTSPIKDRQEWLLKFFNNKEQTSLFLNSLKMKDRKLPNSLSNPLMLYITYRAYIGNVDNKDYNYVEKIIDDTIKGKFKLEKGSGAYGLQYKMDKYQKLVYAICYEILKKSETDAYDINYDENDTTEFEISILKKDNLFCKFEDLSESTKHMISELKTGDFITDDNYFLNCYFWKIDMKTDMVFMKDTNVLFYLAAQKQAKIIVEFLENNCKYESCEKFYKHLRELDFCGFNYRVIDYLLDYFKSNKETHKSIIDSMEYVIEVLHSKNISDKLINKKIAFFYLLFIKIYSGDYMARKIYHHIFKDLFFISKSLRKTYSKDKYRYTIERYFMNLKIESAIIKRLNLKYYNFKGSTIKSTFFKQCKFYDNSFENTHIHKLNFEHSSLNKVTFIIENEEKLDLRHYESNYNIKFSNCIVRCSKIDNSDITIFKNCDISNLDIVLKKSKQLVFFNNCRISDLKISSSNNTSVAIFNLVDFVNDCNYDKFEGKIYSLEKDLKHEFNEIQASHLLSILDDL